MSSDEDDLKRRLQQMENYEFEQFVADLWKRQGWTATVSQESVDAGIDVTAVKNDPYPQKQLIQAKRYGANTTVGGPDVQQYASLKQQEKGVDSVLVVTTSSFTRHAEARAKDLNVKLIDGDDLVGLIDRIDAYDLVEEYVPSPRASQSTSSAEKSSAASSVDDTQPVAGRSEEDWSSSSDRSTSSGWRPSMKRLAALTFGVVLVVGLLVSGGANLTPSESNPSAGAVGGAGSATPAQSTSSGDQMGGSTDSATSTQSATATASSPSLSASVVNKTSSESGLSDFDLLVRADTRLSDTDPEDENPGEPFFVVKVNNESIVETDQVERQSNSEFPIAIEQDNLAQFDEGPMRVTVILMDEDRLFDDEIVRWSTNITYSPS